MTFPTVIIMQCTPCVHSALSSYNKMPRHCLWEHLSLWSKGSSVAYKNKPILLYMPMRRYFEWDSDLYNWHLRLFSVFVKATVNYVNSMIVFIYFSNIKVCSPQRCPWFVKMFPAKAWHLHILWVFKFCLHLSNTIFSSVCPEGTVHWKVCGLYGNFSSKKEKEKEKLL